MNAFNIIFPGLSTSLRAGAGKSANANFMLVLNLISNELKKDNKLKAIFESIKKILAILIIAVSIYAILILFAKLYLQINFVKTINETSLITGSIKSNDDKVKIINNQLKAIADIQSETVLWSYLLERLSKDIKSDIKIENLKLSMKNNTISLRGLAKTRESLLDLKAILENKNCFSDINLPIKNLLEKNNINFEISAKIKSYEFDQL